MGWTNERLRRRRQKSRKWDEGSSSVQFVKYIFDKKAQCTTTWWRNMDQPPVLSVRYALWLLKLGQSGPTIGLRSTQKGFPVRSVEKVIQSPLWGITWNRSTMSVIRGHVSTVGLFSQTEKSSMLMLRDTQTLKYTESIQPICGWKRSKKIVAATWNSQAKRAI